MKVRRRDVVSRACRCSFAFKPLACGLAAALSLGAFGCGNDDSNSSNASDSGGSGMGGGSSGTSGKGGSTSRGGASGKGGSNATGGSGAAPTGGSAGKAAMIDPGSFDGQEVFRFDTFGDEQLWTDTLHLNDAIQQALDPMTALSLGLKVDAAVLPDGILETADLTDPATTVALIGMNAVVGVKGTVDAQGNLTSVGVTCALCHSNVDDSVMPGIGMRLDGQANHDLDPGAIIALSPGLAGNQDALDVYNSWGPGMYDPRFNQDGMNHPVVIPSIYGLKDVPLETYTGDGPVSYWNAYVGITQMGGIGNFFDPRIDVKVFYDRDLVTPKLPALFDYEMSLEAPAPPDGSFDADAADRGETLFEGDVAKCGNCHMEPNHTDIQMMIWHAPEETGMDPITAQRSATGMYRTTPLRGLFANGPYFHDGSAETLADVVDHYDTAMDLGLTADQKADIVEYLKSL